jgi:hypothetical protein
MTDEKSQPIADLSGMPQPTRLTLRTRKNLPYQLGRFGVLSSRMIRMVLAGHGDAVGHRRGSGKR